MAIFGIAGILFTIFFALQYIYKIEIFKHLPSFHGINPAVPVMSIFIIIFLLLLSYGLVLLFDLTQKVNKKVKAAKALVRVLHIAPSTQC